MDTESTSFASILLWDIADLTMFERAKLIVLLFNTPFDLFDIMPLEYPITTTSSIFWAEYAATPKR